MQFANYNDFRVALITLIEGDDLASNSFSVNTADLIIGLGEGRVYHGDAMTAGLRASTMVTALDLTVTDNAAELPDDLLELKELYFPGEKPLEIVPLDHLRTLIASGTSFGIVQYAAQDGDLLTFWPSASSNVQGSYYVKPADLSTGLNTTFARYPELFLYACLYEAALFLGMEDKMPLWEKRYRELANGALHSERMRTYGGGRLRQRVS